MSQLSRKIKAYYLFGNFFIKDEKLIADIKQMENIFNSMERIPLARFVRHYKIGNKKWIVTDECSKVFHCSKFYFRSVNLIRITNEWDTDIMKIFIKRFLKTTPKKVYFR